MSKYPKEETLYNDDYSLKLEYESKKKDKEWIYKFKVYWNKRFKGVLYKKIILWIFLF